MFLDVRKCAEAPRGFKARGEFSCVRTEIQQKTFEAIRAGAEVVARAKTGEVEIGTLGRPIMVLSSNAPLVADCAVVA